MYDMKVYGAGTMRPHFGFPLELHELVRKLNDKNSPLDVGEYEWMMAPLGDDRDASFLAVVWRDVGYVKFISTFHSPKEVLIYRRQPGKSAKKMSGRVSRASRTTTRTWVAPTFSTRCGITTRRNAKLSSGGMRCFSGSSTTPCWMLTLCTGVISGTWDQWKEADPTAVHYQGSGGASGSHAEQAVEELAEK